MCQCQLFVKREGKIRLVPVECVSELLPRDVFSIHLKTLGFSKDIAFQYVVSDLLDVVLGKKVVIIIVKIFRFTVPYFSNT